MRLPDLIEIPSSREIISEFRGYNHRLRIVDGEFYDMKNLTSDHYPVLSPRGKRGVYKNNTNKISGLLSKDKLCYVMGDTFYYGDKDMITSLDPSSEKTVVGMGAYALIFPDMKYVNIKDENDSGDMLGKTVTVKPRGNIDDDGVYKLVSFCDNEGIVIGAFTDDVSTLAGEGIYYDYDAGKIYNKNTELEISESPLCMRFSDVEAYAELNEGDRIEISEMGIEEFNGRYIVVKKIAPPVSAIVCEFKDVPQADDPNWWKPGYRERNEFTITQLMPICDTDIIESHNRLWGCRYGKNLDNEFVNEIFASKLGSFKEWYCLEGTSQDSYYASVGSDGVFTGAIEYGGTPIFFKERCMHRIYGDYPATYQVQTIACSGVQDGCGKSLAIVNSVLFYKARDGIYAYDGSVPVCISEPLGDLSKYKTAVGCAVGLKYYVSMTDFDGKSDMFVYDTSRGMWHKEDSPVITEMVSHNGNGYFLTTEGESSVIYTVNGNEESDVAWMAETGIIGVDDPDTKYISRLDVRMLLTVGTRVTISIQYDSSGEWEHVYTATGINLQSFSVPIRARRCDHFRLRIQGRGDAKIFALCKNVEQGGSSS